MKQYKLSEIPQFTVGEGDDVRYAQFVLGPERGNHHGLTLDAVTLMPHSHTDAHIHDDLTEIWFFPKAAVLSIDGEKHQLEDNTVVLVHPGESHMVENNSDEELTWLCIFAPAWEKSVMVKEFIKQNPI